MLTFPTLRTGSVVQYPLQVSKIFGNDVLTFLGGDEQRYRTMPTPLRSWQVQLDLLDEAELGALEALFQATRGASTTFAFVDPVTGDSIPKCSFDSDSLLGTFAGDARANAKLVLREARA